MYMCKNSSSRLYMWIFFFISPLKLFSPKFELPNSGCNLSTSAAYLPMFIAGYEILDGYIYMYINYTK